MHAFDAADSPGSMPSRCTNPVCYCFRATEYEAGFVPRLGQIT
jgi:hypothetical protein